MWLLLLLFFQWCLLLTRRGVSTVLPALLATPSSPWSKFRRQFKLNYESLKALCRLSHVICLMVSLCSLSRFFSLSSIWDCLLLLPNCFFLPFSYAVSLMAYFFTSPSFHRPPVLSHFSPSLSFIPFLSSSLSAPPHVFLLFHISISASSLLYQG